MDNQDKKSTDVTRAWVISTASFVVIVSLVAGIWFPDRIPGGPPAAMITAFVAVFATIAWATIQGAEEENKDENP